MSDKKDDALKLAQAFVRWTQFGECRTEHHEGPIPTAAQVDAAIREALAEQPEPQSHCNDCGGFDPDCPLAQPAQQEIDELTAQRDWLADILTRTANALKGQPAELSSHSWHDLPEVAQQLKAAQREPWTGLTDEEIEDAWPFVWRKHESVRHFAIYHAIEAKLKEKNA